MDKMLIAKQLYRVVDKTQVVYLRVDPELPDFTIHNGGTLSVMSPLGCVDIPFDRHTIRDALSLLDVSVFVGKAVLAWNFKNLVSYARFYTKKTRTFNCLLFDLKLMEGFVGRRTAAPVDFSEASNRVNELAKNKVWKRVYEDIHIPLATRVVPALECEGIIDISKKQVVYSHYEIDRTPTGRMVCQVPGRGFNPHGIGKSDNYKPRGEDEMFLHLDFRSMEVRILQWLSHDLVLGELLNGERDVYEAAWERITGQTTTPDQWKTTFLAVFFGMGAEAMSMRHGWSPEISKEIIVRMGKVFPLAMGYVRDAQEHAKTQIATDYFGRPRDVRDNPYLARNHVIQSPASVVCMEKLIKLYDELPPPARLGFSVHDGYVLYCEPRALMDVTKRVISILESESNLCPGLRLPVSAKVGARLNKLVSIPTTWR